MSNTPIPTKRRKEKRPPAFYVRYVNLEPSRIFNTLDPKHQNCSFSFWNDWGDSWWEDETVKKREYYAQCYKEEHNKITGHFSKLRESIVKDGLKHPILVVSGPWRDMLLKQLLDTPPWFPPHLQQDCSQGLYVHTHGGSRFMVAEELGMQKIPCAVIDFANLFPSEPEINQFNYHQWFGKNFMWSSKNVRLVNRTQSHLQGTRYRSMNQSTRDAQQTARERAVKRTRDHFAQPVDPKPE